MPLSPPKVVVPLTACTDRVRLQGQRTGALVTIFASATNVYDKVFEGVAAGPDQAFETTRPLRAGEHVFAQQAVPGDAPGSFVAPETVQPEPDPSELTVLTPDAHLHACASCGALGDG